MPFTIDMNRCPACSSKPTCTNRKLIVETLSKLSLDLSVGPQAEGPGDGIIIVHCQYAETQA